MTITQEELKKLLHYHPETGVFTWKIKRSNKIKIGQVAGNLWINTHNNKKYRRLYIDGKLYYSHRIAWLYMTGFLPIDQIDHIDGDGTNNRYLNLREVSDADNHKNQKKYISNSSGITGISWNSNAGKWQCSIQSSNKSIYLGLYGHIFDAVCARKNAEIKYEFHRNHGINRPL